MISSDVLDDGMWVVHADDDDGACDWLDDDDADYGVEDDDDGGGEL